MIVPEVIALVRDEFDPARDPFLRFGGVSTEYNERLAPRLVPLLTDPALRLATMDRQGVRYQAVSIAPPQYHYWAEPDLDNELIDLPGRELLEVIVGVERPIRA